MAVALEYILLSGSLLNGVTILSYFIEVPWVLQSCVKDISFDVSSLNVDGMLNRNRIEMIHCFRNIAMDFSTVKGLSENSDRLDQKIPDKLTNQFYIFSIIQIWQSI